MEGVLRSYGKDEKDNSISILIASTSIPIRGKLFHALTHKREHDCKYQVKVHTCERVGDVVKSGTTMHVDYVVFLLNLKEETWLKEKLDDDISFLDSVIKFGRFCIVNGYISNGIELAMNYKYLLSVRKKYGNHMLVGDIMDEERCSYLAERIHILARAACGLRSGVPYLDYPLDGMHPKVDANESTDSDDDINEDSESSDET